MTALGGLLDGAPDLVNVGVESFAGPPAAHGASVVTLDLRPPAGGDDALGLRLARLIADPDVEAANVEALEGMLAVRPRGVDVARAGDLLPVLDEQRLLLHAGPPIAWEDMCGPMRAGVIGGALLEGSASMPLIVAEDPATGARAYTNLNEGAGRALRYGALGDDVMQRLRWINERLGPSLRAALRDLDEPIDLKSITAQALQMGDECHSRNVAASALLTRALAPGLAK